MHKEKIIEEVRMATKIKRYCIKYVSPYNSRVYFSQYLTDRSKIKTLEVIFL